MQNLVALISGAILPVLFILALAYGLFRRVNVYDAFTEGAAEGLPVLLRVLPYLAGMLMAIRVLRESGLLNALTNLSAPLLSGVGIDANLLPLILLRPLSGSGSMAIVKELMSTFGADSLVSYTAGILMGSSETIFYEAALYFGSIGITKTRYTIPVALISSLVGVIAGVLVANLTY